MNVVLSWVKSNVYTVVFVAVMIAAPIALGIVARNMNQGVREVVKTRASKLAELAKLEKTSVSISNPVRGNKAVSASILINPKLLDRYQEVVGKIGEDAKRIRAEVLSFNHRDRGVLLAELFPEPPMHERETLPFEMHRRLEAAYRQLLEEIGAGAPPSADDVRDDLSSARERFMTQILIKEGGEALTEDEQTWLREQLTKTRLSKYAEAAKHVRIYATMDALEVPPQPAVLPGLTEMFEWQWRFWISEDILLALALANEDDESVLDAPVKRLVSLTVDPYGSASGSAGDAGSGFNSGLGSGRRRSGSSRGGKAPGPAKANPSRELQLDYSLSFTGRKSNAIYDVRHVELQVVVDTRRIPEVLDALSRQNFITITDARVDAEDIFSAVKDGYFYGRGPVVTLTLQLETIWLREWTAPFMPPELKQALGIPVETQSTG